LSVATDPWDVLTPSPSSTIPSSAPGVSTAPFFQATSSSSSGEFNAFSFVGAAVAGGGE
jgi:hypothetical protein